MHGNGISARLGNTMVCQNHPALLATSPQAFMDGSHEIFRRKRLPQYGARFCGPRGKVLHRAGDEQNGNVGADGPDPLDQLVAADIGHDNIADYQIDFAWMGREAT
jgi:hypothetical protein